MSNCFTKITFLIFAIFFPLLSLANASGETVEYTLVIDEKKVNFSGSERTALAINNQIPGPVLSFNEGDTAVLHVINKLEDQETSIHWHGILLPNQYDGVPYITTMPIKAGGSHTFTFELKHSGTYWYHSHTGLQEQQGIYGSIVIQPKEKRYHVDHEVVLLLSDWTDEKPSEVLRALKRGSEWYSIKKGLSQSWDRVIREGAVVERLNQSFNRMPPMDISDVYYEAFLTNGIQSVDFSELKPGEKVRLRVVNGSASTYFHLQFAENPLKVISADGIDVQPFAADRLLIAVAETYDFLLTVPSRGAFEFRATAQDGSGYSSAFIGAGEKVAAPDVPKPELFGMADMMDGMDMSGMGSMDGSMQMDKGSMHMDSNGMQDMKMDKGSMPMDSNGMQDMKMDKGSMPMDSNGMQDMKMDKGSMPMDSNGMQDMKMDKGSMPMETKEMKNMGVVEDYSPLKALESTTLPSARPLREITLKLTGNMDRYVWSFDNVTLSEADKILIKKGENVRITMINTTMMHHPIHLHGHFFRVLNGQGKYAPLKHTVDVRPMGKTVIEFEANDEKDWFFHCHVLYHMVAGMARVVSYEGSTLDPELVEVAKNKEKGDTDFYAWGDVAALTHMNEGNLTLTNLRTAITMEWENDWSDKYEIEPTFDYYLTQFFSLYVGADLDDEEQLAVAGIHYTLPLYIDSELRIDNNGDVRLKVGSELQLLPRLMFHWQADTDSEWRYGLEWIVTKDLSIVGNHDSDYGAGVGLEFRF